MLRSVLGVLCLAMGAMAWINAYDQPENFQCPEGQFLSRISSQHDNHHEDRLWDFGCSPIIVEGALNCQWTNYVNDWDQPVTFQCSNDGVLTGIDSVHDNHHEDRRFKYRCCEVAGAITHACYFTAWQNQWDATFEYNVPNNKVLRGMDSYHDNHHEDRRFKFEVCDMVLQD